MTITQQIMINKTVAVKPNCYHWNKRCDVKHDRLNVSCLPAPDNPATFLRCFTVYSENAWVAETTPTKALRPLRSAARQWKQTWWFAVSAEEACLDQFLSGSYQEFNSVSNRSEQCEIYHRGKLSCRFLGVWKTHSLSRPTSPQAQQREQIVTTVWLWA